MKLVRLSVFCTLAALTALPQVAHADLLFSNYTLENVTTTTNANQVLGTEFLVGASNLLVTDLGVYDNNQNGLVFPHQVGIWRVSDQALVGSATVPTTGNTLIEKWRFTTASFTLSASTTYRIGALESLSVEGNPFGGTFVSSGSITASGGASSSVFSGSGFAFPSSTNGVARVFANAQFTVAGGSSAPEPGTLALLALGGVCALARRRRRVAR